MFLVNLEPSLTNLGIPRKGSKISDLCGLYYIGGPRNNFRSQSHLRSYEENFETIPNSKNLACKRT